MILGAGLLLEPKAVHEVFPMHKAQWLSDRNLLNVPLALLFSFREFVLVDRILRIVLPGANAI